MTRTRLPRTLLRAVVPAAAVLAVAVGGAGAASADTVASTAYDLDGDGYYDTLGFDGDQDGYEDTYAYDLDEDGYVEQVGVDTDGDGWEDTWAFDEEEDGYVEAVGVDTTGNGAPDVWGADLDLDGYVDTMFYDADDDGVADWSEAADDYDYEYEVITYVFVESDGWLYWETSYEYGSGGYDYVTSTSDEAGTPASALESAGVDSSTGAPESPYAALAYQFAAPLAHL